MITGQAQADTPTTTPAGNAMSGATQRDLGAELARLRASNNSGPVDRSMGVLGIIAAIAGLVIILVSFAQSRGFSDIRDQMDSLILSLFGIGLIIIGSALYLRAAMTRFLRYWLLRMVYEQRDLARNAGSASAADE
jgi:hypothetical protein